MKPHTHLTIVRNRYRARELRAFRDLVEVYFQQSERDPDGLPIDWDGAQAARSRINQMLPRIIQVVRAAGLGEPAAPHMTTDPGPALGRVEVLQRIFTAHYTDGAEQEVLDVLDMALGVYEADRHVALGRTFNPFHYVGEALAFLARGPKRVLTALGLRRPSPPRVPAGNFDGAVHLSDVEELLEARLATLQDRQAMRHGEHARQLAELAERLDFAERMLAQPRPQGRLPEPEKNDIVTPV